MNNSNNQIKLKLILLLPLLTSMVFVGFYNISNANQTGNLELNQFGSNFFPVMGYASITTNGQAIDGDTFANDVAGIDVSSDYIQFYTYRHELITGGSAASFRDTTRVAPGPVIVTKSVDKATPLLAQGLIQNHVVEAQFLFFNLDQEDGTTVHHFTVSITGGRISSLRTFTVVGEGGSQIVEEISFSYNQLTWTDMETGAEAIFDWQAGA
ncbi:MAG: type VI secretion system tube protein Hcp [Candidatus Heimdallarchaeota archaeon]|nr:type VI secretion system tube protein Hcp [Candidatus Heimdallarchaeota archaeon]